MLVKHVLFAMVAMITILMVPALSRAEYLTIRMPTSSDGLHEYYYELLAMALEQDGHIAAIEEVADMPHLREMSMLETGEVDVLWLVQSEARDKQYIPVPIKLTNGMAGQRILLIPPGNMDDYKDVETVGDLRRLGKVGGFGKEWFDVRVWEANFLPYLEVAEWRLLYGMVANTTREVDYFSRAFNEVVKEVENHPELIIEPHLMFVYNRDFIFYVSPKSPRLASFIECALIKARDTGLMGRLLKKHWARNYDIIKPGTRTIIKLKTPQ
ncbi:MAG: hypothetical protein OCC46_00255 [Pseudodesulfovibrio sp.]